MNAICLPFCLARPIRQPKRIGKYNRLKAYIDTFCFALQGETLVIYQLKKQKKARSNGGNIGHIKLMGKTKTMTHNNVRQTWSIREHVNRRSPYACAFILPISCIRPMLPPLLRAPFDYGEKEREEKKRKPSLFFILTKWIQVSFLSLL